MVMCPVLTGAGGLPGQRDGLAGYCALDWGALW
jgi:hypothetical protein